MCPTVFLASEKSLRTNHTHPYVREREERLVGRERTGAASPDLQPEAPCSHFGYWYLHNR